MSLVRRFDVFLLREGGWEEVVIYCLLMVKKDVGGCRMMCCV